VIAPWRCNAHNSTLFLREPMCGRRERETSHEDRRELKPFALSELPRVGTVEGIPVFRIAALFAELRWNEGLGRSVSVWLDPQPQTGAPTTADVRRLPRRGTFVGMRVKAHAPDAARHSRLRSGTRPSLGPSTRARRSSLHTAGAILGGGASGGHHGWANSRKREEPALGFIGRTKRDSPRGTASARRRA